MQLKGQKLFYLENSLLKICTHMKKKADWEKYWEEIAKDLEKILNRAKSYCSVSKKSCQKWQKVNRPH